MVTGPEGLGRSQVEPGLVDGKPERPWTPPGWGWVSGTCGASSWCPDRGHQLMVLVCHSSLLWPPGPSPTHIPAMYTWAAVSPCPPQSLLRPRGP